MKLSDRWRKPLAIATDADGRFRIPTETDPSALLVAVHESGYLQRPFSDLVKAVREPAYATELNLQPWGKISGHIDWKERSADGERVELIVSRETLYPDMVGMSASTRSDAEGSFTFEDVPPGPAQVSRLVAKPDGSGPSQYQFPVVHPEVQAGGETDVVLGRKGPAVVGRLTGLESFEGVTLRVHPRAPHIGFAGDDEQWAGWSALAKSPLGSVVFRDNVAVEADGSFRIEGLIAESYQLILNDRGRGLRGGTSFVLQAADQADDGIQNIGEIRVSQTKQ